MRSIRTTRRQALPLEPLLHAYTAPGLASIAELHRLPGVGARFAAILAARARFLDAALLDRAGDDRLRDALLPFHEAVVAYPVHAATLARRVGFVRHALSHLLHGRDPAARKLDACLSAGGTYRVPGLGPTFWSALLQGTAPARQPGWTPAAVAGLRRLGLAALPAGSGAAAVYAALQEAHARIRAAHPALTPLHIDHFLALVGIMSGQDVHAAAATLADCPVTAALTRLRAATPLRQRLKQRGEELARGQHLLVKGLQAGDGKRLGEALALADPAGAASCPLDWGRHAETLALWVGRLWEADDPHELLARFWRGDPLPGAGLWLPAAVLHLRDPQRFAPFHDALVAGLTVIDDGIDAGDPPAERYRLTNEAIDWLQQRFGLHPLEAPELLAALAGAGTERAPTPTHAFRGFSSDSFAFLAELAGDNHRAWMERQRARYRFAVREPLAALCRGLAAGYIEPVLGQGHGWPMVTAARNGHALTSICRNVYGRSSPYCSTVWITFYPRGQTREAVQLFVRLAPDGLRYGLRLGRGAEAARTRLREAVARHGELLLQLLAGRGALAACRFGLADGPGDALSGADALAARAAGRTLEASCHRSPAEVAAAGETLLDEIAATFDALLPLLACAVEDDATAALTRLAGRPIEAVYSRRDFVRQTYLDEDWLDRSLDLLALKKQLILQGVPGTGKTHVARCLARLLARGDDAVTLVQFHPAYGYEEFVEGIRVRSVTVDGRQDVTYPVEDGVLLRVAARAAAEPSRPHVLIIDEINRGNLPRLFGELLYLLEYRGQAVELPLSGRRFHLPANLYLLGTMNAADRSIAPVDQALRRRFSFVNMEPDSRVLTAWLARQPELPTALASRVVGLFERLNARLRGDVGPHARVGHSHFMVPGLDEARLETIWRHHIEPLLDELYAGRPGGAPTPGQLWPAPGRPRRPAVVPRP